MKLIKWIKSPWCCVVYVPSYSLIILTSSSQATYVKGRIKYHLKWIAFFPGPPFPLLSHFATSSPQLLPEQSIDLPNSIPSPPQQSTEAKLVPKIKYFFLPKQQISTHLVTIGHLKILYVSRKATKSSIYPNISKNMITNPKHCVKMSTKC